jgi:hypothetical protein
MAAWNGLQAWRQWRMVRLWTELDTLLAKMAMESLQNRYLPLWAAWSGIMGDIEVSITSKRRREKID